MSEYAEFKGAPREEYSSAQYTFSIFKKSFPFLLSSPILPYAWNLRIERDKMIPPLHLIFISENYHAHVQFH